MALLELSDIDEMIEAIGDPVTIAGAVAFSGIFEDGPKEIVQNGVSEWTDTPVLTVSIASASTVTLNSAIMTIGGVAYQAFEKSETNLRVQLYLTRDF